MMKRPKAQLLKANGKVIDIRPAKGWVFTLEELQRLVGGYIETARTNTGENTVLVVREDGHGLPPNARATSLYLYGGIRPSLATWSCATGRC